MDYEFRTGLKALALLAISTLLVIIVLLLLTIFFPLSANAADLHRAIIEYTSADDLTARVDLVIGVCDTTYWIEHPCHQNADSIRTRDSIIGTRIYVFYPTDSIEIKSDHYGMPVHDTCRTYYYPTITCRELICVLKYSEPDSQRRWENILVKDPQGELEINGTKYSIVNYTLIPGQAIIWWEEVEE